MWPPNRIIWLRILAVIFLLSIPQAFAQMDCSKAPTPSLRVVCEQIHHWDANARAAPTPNKNGIILPPGIDPADIGASNFEIPQVAATAEQCMTLGCLCSYMGGNGNDQTNQCTLSSGQPLRKSVRKEYRMLTDDERDRYHAALWAIKRNGAFDEIARTHSQFAESGAAHAGPAFLPWHREFTKRMEIALRRVDPTVNIPYWDSVMDGYLPRSQDSILWTEDFMGNPEGAVTTGPFAGWKTIEGKPNIQRKVGAEGSVFSEQNVADFIGFTDINKVLAPTAPRQGCPDIPTFSALEYSHGNVHLYVGGDMHETQTSANDPIFYSHHAFVDLIWEAWRLGHQDRESRETDYPLDNNLCSSNFHFSSAYMEPFRPWRNSDGLSNQYTDNLFEYAPRPSCPACGGSKYLFCIKARGKCASKVKIGGSCQGLSDADGPCYNGACRNGVCVASGPAEVPKPKPPPKTHPKDAPIEHQKQETCFNGHQCCAVWASTGECQTNAGYMRPWCRASCGVCKPKYDLKKECSDRHMKCAQWSQSGECTKNFQWMAENCRKACGKCGQTRAQSCPGGRAAAHPAPAAPTSSIAAGTGVTQSCTSPGCFNENMCCQYWGRRGECNKNPIWMTCNCRVSCGMCRPPYNYGGCQDHHEKCRSWAASGECDKNTWMLENCAQSCKTCYSDRELRDICRLYKGRRPRDSGFGFFGGGPFGNGPLVGMGMPGDNRNDGAMDIVNIEAI